MKVVLLTTLPNCVATTLSNLLGTNLYSLDITKVENKKESIMGILHNHASDVLITYRCPYILPNDILTALPFGAYNVHPSLLPKYKGMNPWKDIFRNQESKSGVTLHRIISKIDSGGIVSQKSFIITPSDTIESARIKADELAAELAKNFVTNLMSNISLLPLPNKFDYQEAIISRENLLFIKESDCWEYNDIYKEGAFCIVFQMQINESKYAIRCWKCLTETNEQVIDRRMMLISKWIKNVQPLYLNNIFWYRNGIKTIKGVHPIAMMKWHDDMSLKEYLYLYSQKPLLLENLSDTFITMVSYFHNLHIAHGDMNMDNIRVKTDGSLYLIDYDSFYVPIMKYEKDDIKGKLEYQHHGRYKNLYLSEYMDYYSEYIIFITIKSLAKYPELWIFLELSDTNFYILNKEELANIKNSRIYSFFKEKSDVEFLNYLNTIDDIWQNESCLNAIIPIEKSKIIQNIEQSKNK